MAMIILFRLSEESAGSTWHLNGEQTIVLSLSDDSWFADDLNPNLSLAGKKLC